MTPAARLAAWILSNDRVPTTHLRLQKLCFYAYGTVRAMGADGVDEIPFEAWQHGPVIAELWLKYRDFGRTPIPTPADRGAPYPPATESVLDDVMAVYGRLSAWELRNQSHLEAPWRDTFDTSKGRIPESAIEAHFRRLLRLGDVQLPAYLSGRGSFALDRIPAARYPSFHALAQSLEG